MDRGIAEERTREGGNAHFFKMERKVRSLETSLCVSSVALEVTESDMVLVGRWVSWNGGGGGVGRETD